MAFTANAVWHQRPLVIFDLEFTAWPGSRERRWSAPGEFREIVQIGAIGLDGDDRETDSFDLLVRPIRNPRLSAYFTELTGITDDMVASRGVDLVEALARFDRFVAGRPLACFGQDLTVLAENCALQGLLDVWRDRPCHRLDRAFAAVRPDLVPGTSSGDLPARLGLAWSARAHDAVSDARALAAALAALAPGKKQGEDPPASQR